MSAIRCAFLPYPKVLQTTPGLSNSITRTCDLRICARKEDPSKKERHASSENVCDGAKNFGRRPPNRSVRDIATRIGEARDKFRKASDEARALESSPEGFVLGSDFSKLGIGSMSAVQDLDIPAAPRYWGLAPQEVLTLLQTCLRREGIPESQCSEYIEELRDILAALRGWSFAFADQARPLLELTDFQKSDADHKVTTDAIDAIVALLQLSGFAVLPDIPAITDPPCPEALPLGNSIEETLDPTLLRKSSAVSKHIKSNGVHIGSPSYYPYLFIATRGVSVVRKSGLLVPQKIRAIERSYFNWIRTPFALLMEPFRALSASAWKQLLKAARNEPSVDGKSTSGDGKTNVGDSSANPSGAVDDLPSERRDRKRVRRVVPAVQLEGGLDAVTQLFLPTFTQEPAHELMLLLYREVELDKESIRKETRRALVQQVKDSIAQAINPMPSKRQALQISAMETEASILDSFEQPLGAVKPVTLQMFADVQWGTMPHFFPSTFVLPATTDLLRIDALTFLGLVSTVVTYARNSENAFVFAVLAGSIITYALRVAFGWRSALINYRGQIARDRAGAILSRQRSTLDSLAGMAAEEQFPDVCCVWLSRVLRNGKQASDLQQEAFGEVSLSDETVQSWHEWLEANTIFKG